ncbi:MAG: RNA polymerase sigma factor [Myxococcota bacterium]
MRQERDQRWSIWMVAAQKGDSASYEKLLRELIPHVRRQVQRRIFDASAVEDVVQNVFVSLHRARATYRPERPFLPWINAVTRNAVVDAIREWGRRGRREVSLEAEGVPEPAVEAAEPRENGLSAELQGALERLPTAQRQAVLMIHVEGLSIAEASVRAGVSKSALKVRAHRGYRALRLLLEEAEA